MSTTSKGVPFPDLDGSTDNDIPTDVKALADWVDARPGIAVVTTTARNALSGVELWDGRVVLNTTTGQLNRYVAGSSSWVVVGVGDHGQLLGLGDDDHPQYLTGARHDARDHGFILATTGTPAPNGFTGELGETRDAARADHVHPVGVSEISASSAPSSWPAGVSVMEITTSPGWPFTIGTLLTFRSANVNRGVQIATERTTGATFTRAATSTGTWGSWEQTVFDDDPRLADARTPTAHTHAAADIVSGILALARLPVAASGVSSSTQVVRADDSRLANARTPTAHTHAAADIVSGVLAAARLGSGTPAAGKYVDGTGAWKPLTDTPGALLAAKSYNPGALVTYQTSNAAGVDVDPTNLAVTFTVPASGKVVVHLEAVGGTYATDGPNIYWCLRSGSSMVAGSQAYMCNGTSSGAGFDARRSCALHISGLTPGAVLTWKWGHLVNVSPSSGTSRILAGNDYGPATMEVYAA